MCLGVCFTSLEPRNNQVGSLKLDLSAHAKELLETAPEKLKDKDRRNKMALGSLGMWPVVQDECKMNQRQEKKMAHAVVDLSWHHSAVPTPGPPPAGAWAGEGCCKRILVHCTAGSGRGNTSHISHDILVRCKERR